MKRHSALILIAVSLFSVRAHAAKAVEKPNELLVMGFQQYSENNRGRVMLFKDVKVSGEKCTTSEENSTVQCTVDQVVLVPNVDVNFKGQEGLYTYAIAGIIKDQTTVKADSPVKLTGSVTLSSKNKGVSWQVSSFKLKKM